MAKRNMGGWLTAIFSFLRKHWIVILAIISAIIVLPQVSAILKKILGIGSDVVDDGAKKIKELGLGETDGIKVFNVLAADPVGAFSPLLYKNAPPGASLITYAFQLDYAKKIYDSLGYFSYDFEAIMGVFHQLKAKTQVSILAQCFYDKYTKDLLTFLKPEKWYLSWRNTLTSDEFLQLTNYVHNLKAM